MAFKRTSKSNPFGDRITKTLNTLGRVTQSVSNRMGRGVRSTVSTSVSNGKMKTRIITTRKFSNGYTQIASKTTTASLKAYKNPKPAKVKAPPRPKAYKNPKPAKRRR